MLEKSKSELSGLENVKSHVFEMMGHVPNLYWRICWKFVSPIFLMVKHAAIVDELPSCITRSPR